MKKILVTIGAVALSVSLAGCAGGPRSYSTVEDLKAAYVQAGGACDKGTVIDTSGIVGTNADLQGLTGFSCTNDVGLFVFPNTKARDYFIDLIDGASSASKTGVHMVVGDKWLVGGVTLDNKKLAPALGGKARY
jgi:hypothetical protein